MGIAGENPIIAMIHDLRRVWKWCENGKILTGAIGLAFASHTPTAAYRFDVRSFGVTPNVSDLLGAFARRAMA